MNTFTLLVETQHFAVKVKENSNSLSAYVVDYADNSSFILEQQRIYRYRTLNSCVLGQESPKELISLLKTRNNRHSFFCNKNRLKIKSNEVQRACRHPENYAVVIYNCYK